MQIAVKRLTGPPESWKVGIIGGVSGKSDNYDSVKLEPGTGSDSLIGSNLTESYFSDVQKNAACLFSALHGVLESRAIAPGDRQRDPGRHVSRPSAQDHHSKRKDQALDTGKTEERESTKRGLAANGSENPL